MYKNKSKLKKRLVKRRARRYAPRSKIVRYNNRGPKGMIFPDQYTTKLRYNELFSFGGAPQGYRQYRANSCFDPVLALGGGQPMGYDQLSALYLRYRVNSCSIKVNFSNLTNVPCYVVAYPLTTSSIPAGLQNDLEQRYSKNKMLGGNASRGFCSLTNSVNIAKIMGQPTILDDKYQSSTGSDPLQVIYWNISIYSVDSTTLLNVPASIEITYHVTFTDPVRLGIS